MYFLILSTRTLCFLLYCLEPSTSLTKHSLIHCNVVFSVIFNRNLTVCRKIIYFKDCRYQTQFTCFQNQSLRGLRTEFIHSFLSFIHSFGHFYSAASSPLLLRGAPDYSTNTVSEFHAEAHRQL